ncbi:MAG TPA: choice-of-anchor J domain-containing protein [Chitinophagaceae bacterium]|nr:choice-of-anchor J domain-containing protein [Chitinophagaceae bacterium]
MIKFLPALLITLICITAHAQERKKTIELKGFRTAITPRLSKWKPNVDDPVLRIKTRDEKGLIFSRNIQPAKMTNYNNGSKGQDPAWQQRYRITENPALLTPSESKASYYVSSDISFDGIGFTNISPADPTIAVGPNHIIEMVNGSSGSAYFKIFTKNGGQLALEAFMDQLPGSSYNGAGDCITWYDQLTNRFVMTEFGDSSKTGTAVNSLIMAVSASSDPLGAWYVYEFPDASFFPDYPKYANWGDAWYGMTRDFTGSYIGNSVWAFDKMKMINGAAVATVQRIRLVDTDSKYNSLCPVSLSGSTPPPAGTPGLFLYFSDDNFSASATDTDSLGLVGFKVNFADPSKSTAGVIQSLPAAPFKSDVCIARNCAPSASGQGYDVVSNRVMNRPYYRNFGTHESIVANHTVDATGTGVAGVRWYELRRNGGAWQNYQQGTFAPQDLIPCVDPANKFRFMGAITLNGFGQIAMAYNVSSATSFASIGFTGRNTSDPLNAMSYEETIAVKGTGFGSFGNRWGDYSEIAPDPVNDSLFWFCGMYGSPNGWGTKIFSIKLGKPKQTDAKLVSIDQPNSCESSCKTSVEPLVTVRNAGLNPVNSFVITYQVNSDLALTYNWSGNLLAGEEKQVKLPFTTFPTGNASFSVKISAINGLANDDDGTNDSLSTTTSIGQGISLPLSESFENILFPAIGWSRQTNLSPAANWERTTNAAKTGTGSVFFNNFDQNQPSRYADLRTPLIKLAGSDSLELSFYYAAAMFDLDNVDTLEVLVSSDCGNNYQSVWRKNTREIATREGNVNTGFVPTKNEWRKITIDLNSFAKSSSIIIAFRNINGFGNMVYLDDININAASLPKLDLAIAKISSPAYFVCNTSLKPVVAFTNLGVDTIRSATFMYSINGDLFRTVNWQGVLARKEVGYITMPETILSAGEHSITVYGLNPNQTVDNNSANDSLKISFQVKQALDIPLMQGFETLEFPPVQWTSINEGGGRAWERFNTSADNGIGSAYFHNYNNKLNGDHDELVSPIVSYLNADSIFLSFELAAVGSDPAKPDPASTDTLEIFVSTDCGKTLSSVYRKWGKQLQTISDNLLPLTTDYIPFSGADWRSEKIDLTELLGRNNSFVAIFRNRSQGINNIYLDQVNIFTKQVPAKLKNKGLLISPNPFTGKFIIQHYPDAKELIGIEIFNGIGQLMYHKSSSGGDHYLEIDLSSKPAGMYFVKLSYKDKVVTEKLLKGF